MEPIHIFLIVFITFLTGFGFGLYSGFAFGFQVRSHEELKKTVSDFKKNTKRAFSPRQKVVIIDSKDAYLPDEEEDGVDLLEEEK